jgi:electron transport complex protein RnfB
MFIALIIITLLALAFGLVLGYAAIKYHVEGDPVVEQLDAALPQTQCGQCGYAGCRPYAQAIAAEEAGINLCPPGGKAGVQALADLMGVEAIPLDAQDANNTEDELVAIIIEKECIGCTLCIQACPVDAILGSAKHMHTVIESECTGCKLCVDPCPVDCIIMEPIAKTLDTWVWNLPETLPILTKTQEIS